MLRQKHRGVYQGCLLTGRWLGSAELRAAALGGVMIAEKLKLFFSFLGYISVRLHYARLKPNMCYVLMYYTMEKCRRRQGRSAAADSTTASHEQAGASKTMEKRWTVAILNQ